MILSVTLSKPVNNIEALMGKAYTRIKIRAVNSAEGASYSLEMFTKTQVFHKKMNEKELQAFLNNNAGITFKNCLTRTESEEITLLANKKGKITELKKRLKTEPSSAAENTGSHKLNILPSARKKKYLLPEGKPIPFLQLLGIMNDEGKVISSRYDKFRQINRFLEFIDDVIPEFSDKIEAGKPINIVDFGCGKSYLTFAIHYYLTEIRKLTCEIEGLDLKEEVINYCNEMVKELKLKGISFNQGNITEYRASNSPDLVITLHACDTATDYALKYAVDHNTRVILSVPCCQHQINTQLQNNKSRDIPPEFEPLLKWGIIREKFASLVTDSLRGQWLESKGYKVQMLEFIDMEHTPKNILIRAFLRQKQNKKNEPALPRLADSLKLDPEIFKA